MLPCDELRELKVVETTHCRISLLEGHIIRLFFKDKGEITPTVQDENLVIFRELANHKICALLIESGEGVISTPEARKYSAAIEAESPFCAFGMVTRNLAYRMIVNFYLRVQKPAIPFRVFGTRHEALQWLTQILVSQRLHVEK